MPNPVASSFSSAARSQAPRRLLLTAAACAIASLASTGLADIPDLSPEVQAQIADVLAVKDTFTPAEQKMSSNLVFALRKAQGQDIGSAAYDLTPSLGGSELTTVQIQGVVKNRLRTAINGLGGQVLSFTKGKPLGNVLATVTLDSLPALAANPDVTSIRSPRPLHTNVGALNTQGIKSHQAKQVYTANPAYNGAGVKVGVISDSASQAQVNSLIASGDLGPNSKVLIPYNDGNGGDAATDEGAAIMEIVQDMAPGATVEFATGFIDFPAAVRALQKDGCQVIIDDLGGPEGVFQDDSVALAVNDVTAAGTIYLSSAGNSGSVAHTTTGCWEGDFSNGGTFTPPTGSGSTKSYNVHAFSASQNYDVFTVTGEPYQFLTWSDPLGYSLNDYDLFVTNSAGTTLKGFSVDTQNIAAVQNSPGTVYPFELLGTSAVLTGGNYATQTAGDRFVVTQVVGASARALHFDVERGFLNVGTGGATYGHNAGLNTVSVAATFWNSAKTGAKAFNGTNNPCETFSSDGPRKLFYNADGTAITPGNFLFSTNGGTTLQKPDLTGADGVSCVTPGFTPFFGTSAAAPHAAGVAALMISARAAVNKPVLTPTQIHTLLNQSCNDNEASGVDPTGGNGTLNAVRAVAAAIAQ